MIFHSAATRWIAGLVAAIAVLALLRYKPWQSGAIDAAGSNRTREELKVGFLPVT